MQYRMKATLGETISRAVVTIPDEPTEAERTLGLSDDDRAKVKASHVIVKKASDKKDHYAKTWREGTIELTAPDGRTIIGEPVPA